MSNTDPDTAKARRSRRVAMVPIAAALALGAASCVIHAGGGGDGYAAAYVYEPCAVDADCPGGTQCWVVDMQYEDGIVEDAMCTATCYDDLDCPGDGVCEFAGGDPPLCFRACAGDFDCPGGFACVADAYELGGYPICVPY